jgi:hypothetical protein
MRIGQNLLRFALVGATGWCMCAHAGTDGQPNTAVTRRNHGSHHLSGSRLEDRVSILSKALDLDANQQAAVRKLLLEQRDAVRRVWTDSTVPAAYRVTALKAISDQTADRIRGLLTDKQKEKYKPPPPAHDALQDSTQPDVEYWMNATRAK